MSHLASSCLEAWAAGLPVVAARVGGIPSFTRDGEDVLHADAGDPESFGLAIERLLLMVIWPQKLRQTASLKPGPSSTGTDHRPS